VRITIGALLACATAMLAGCPPPSQGSSTPGPPPGWKAPPPPGSEGYAGPRPSDPIRPVPGQSIQRPIRARPALPSDPDSIFRTRAARMLAGMPGQILFVASAPPESFWRSDDGRLVFWRTLPGVEEALDRPARDGAAQAALAEQLQGQGIRYLLVDRSLAPWTGRLDDRENRLLERLCRGRSLERLHPLLVGRTYLLYRIAPPFEVTDSQARQMTAAVRADLAGLESQIPAAIDLPPSAGGLDEFEVGVALYGRVGSGLRGRPIMRRAGRGTTLPAALADAAGQIRKGWAARRAELSDEAELALPAEPSRALPELLIELALAHDRCEILDRDPSRLSELFEPGLHGAYLRIRDPKGLREHSRYPGFAIDHGMSSPRRLIDSLCTDLAGLRVEAWRDPRRVFGRFLTRVFLERKPGGAVVELRRGRPRVSTAAVTEPRLREARRQAARYLSAIQDGSGRFLYRYRPLADSWIEGNDLHTHALVTLALVSAEPGPGVDGRAEPDLLALHYLQTFLRCEGWKGRRACFLWHTDPTEERAKASVGASALTALALLMLAEQKRIDREQADALAGLGLHLLRMQDPNGHFRQFHVPPGHPYYGCERRDVPGQILLALARLHRYTGEAAYREAFDRGLEFYDARWERLVERGLDSGAGFAIVAPDWLAAAPWQVMARAEMYRQTGDRRYADRLLAIQSATDARFLLTADRAAYSDLAGGVLRAPGEPPDMADALIAAGRAAAYGAAVRAGRERTALRRHVLEGLRFVLEQQHADVTSSAYFMRRPWMVEGAFCSSALRSPLETKHTALALLAIDEALANLAPADPAHPR